MIKKTLILSVLIMTGVHLAAQSNDILDRFLDAEEASLAGTAWLVYLASGALEPDAEPADAIDRLSVSPRAAKFGTMEPGRPVTYGEFAYLAMEELELPGGLMYRLIPGPRYASRELTWRRWMPGEHKSGQTLTPWEVTTSLAEMLAWKEARGE